MTKKLLFFDIDGTLLDKEKNLPSSTKQAIQTLKENGHEVAIATGRPPFMFQNLCEELDINTYVSLNGQYVVVNNEVIYKNPINKEIMQSLTSFSSGNMHPLVYHNHNDMKSNIEYHPHIEESIGTLKLDRDVSFGPDFFKESEIYQLMLACEDKEEIEYKSQFEHLKFIRWHPLAVDVLPTGGSKAIGIQAIINRLGIFEEDVYAFGDELNDMEMLQFVKNSVAMGNAPESVKKVAKHITKDVSKDGVAYGLKILGLLK